MKISGLITRGEILFVLGGADPKVLDKLADCEGFETVLNDMATQWSKFHGGKFQLEYASDLVTKGKRIKFEIVDEGGDLVRRYDIVDLGPPPIRIELKNWSNFYPETIKNQFVKDLAKTNKLGDTQWIFNKTGGINDIATLKTKVMAALKNADGTPIKELDILLKDRKLNSELVTKLKISNSTDLLNQIDINFNEIFKIAD